MKALFSAATGMAAQQIQIDTIANNLANVSTRTSTSLWAANRILAECKQKRV